MTTDHPQSAHAAEAYYHLGENAYWHDREYARAFDAYTLSQQKTMESELLEKAIYMQLGAAFSWATMTKR